MVACSNWMVGRAGNEAVLYEGLGLWLLAVTGWWEGLGTIGYIQYTLGIPLRVWGAELHSAGYELLLTCHHH